MEFEKKTQSRAFHFFDKLFRTFICNILCVASACIPVAFVILWSIAIGLAPTENPDIANPIATVMPLLIGAIVSFLITFPFLILPALVASTDVLKDGTSGVSVFKAWWYAFRTYYVKSMKMGLIYSVLFGISLFSLYFYIYANVIELNQTISKEISVAFANVQNIIFQCGIVVIGILSIAVLLLSVHLPMLIVTLPKMRVADLLKTNVFMAINYFLNTIILFAMLLVSIIGILFFPIWIIFGISLPIVIGIKFSRVNYREIEKVDFDKINDQVEKDLEEEELYE